MQKILRAMAEVIETSSTKRMRLDGPLIGTHNGHFHADEALAVHLLRLLPTYASSPLVRTRDPAVLAKCHTVVDVGGEYDPARNLYDHHQRSFNSTFPGHGTKLSSAGLVYKHLGRAIISAQTELAENSPEMDVVFEKIYTDFIEPFDANDNGISAYDVTQLNSMGIRPRFNERGFSIASVVNRYNHAKTSQTPGSADNANQPPESLQAEEDARFMLASAFTGQQFEAELVDTVASWLPARVIVKEAFDARKSDELDPKGRIMVLPHRKEGLPWSDHLYQFEEADNSPGSVLYVLFPENGEPDSKWRIRAVSKSKEGFELRHPLPESWRGVRDEELDRVSGIDGCVFVHASGFIGGNKTFDGALGMAKKALDMVSVSSLRHKHYLHCPGCTAGKWNGFKIYIIFDLLRLYFTIEEKARQETLACARQLSKARISIIDRYNRRYKTQGPK